MTATLITIVLLGCMLLWIRAWQSGSKLATGAIIGIVLALVALPVLRAVGATGHMPIWLPALPFALVAAVLFAFGVLAWFWGDEEPTRTHESGRTDHPESMTVE